MTEKDDPILGAFLGFIANDITKHPGNLRAIDAGLTQRIHTLAGNVDIDLNAKLLENDE
jgi:antitoxin PrlF